MSIWINWPPSFTLSKTESFAESFPKLDPAFCAGGVSPATEEYNCFAWAAGINDKRWEPDPFFQFEWPESASRSFGRDSYVEAFQSLGYSLCNDGAMELGFEKIAFYCVSGEPAHAARQLVNGNWTTKFGDFEDVEHVNLECLQGPIYGEVTTYMKRVRA